MGLMQHTSLLRLIVIFGLWCRTKGVVKLPPHVSVPAVLAFGDSIVDSGNNNNLTTLVKCDFPPYGKDFQGGKPTGRFCNGKIPSDIIGTLFYLNLLFYKQERINKQNHFRNDLTLTQIMKIKHTSLNYSPSIEEEKVTT